MASSIEARSHHSVCAYWTLGVLVVSLTGCRFGGGSGDDELDWALPADAITQGDVRGTQSGENLSDDGDTGSNGQAPSGTGSMGVARDLATDTEASPSSSSATMSADPLSAPDAGPTGALMPRGGAAAGSGSAMTSPAGAQRDTASAEVCDPIANTGCPEELGMQCDVDVLAAGLTGACVFSAESTQPTGCLNIPPTETCPGGQTCVGNERCSKICLEDDDCDAGECCDTDLGNSDFKACNPC